MAGSTSSELLTLRDELEDPFLQDEQTLSARTAALGGDPYSRQSLAFGGKLPGEGWRREIA